MWQIQMHMRWCRHQMFINHWQSVTQTSKVYSSLFIDFHKLLGHFFRRQLVYSSFVYHTVLMQIQLWILLQKRAFLCPRASPYNKGSGAGSGAPVKIKLTSRHLLFDVVYTCQQLLHSTEACMCTSKSNNWCRLIWFALYAYLLQNCNHRFQTSGIGLIEQFLIALSRRIKNSVLFLQFIIGYFLISNV